MNETHQTVLVEKKMTLIYSCLKKVLKFQNKQPSILSLPLQNLGVGIKENELITVLGTLEEKFYNLIDYVNAIYLLK